MRFEDKNMVYSGDRNKREDGKRDKNNHQSEYRRKKYSFMKAIDQARRNGVATY